MVQSVKRILRKVLQNTRVTYDEMLTILSKIENIVNNRPLTYLYEEVGESITPNHLLFGRNLNTVWGGCSDLEDENETVDRRADYLKTVLIHFWNRWQKEYLRELREYRHNKKSTGDEIFLGDIVLIEDGKLRRSMWRIGKIVELIYSKNNEVRAAVVDVISETGKKGQIRRPINKLYPIESSFNNNDNIRNNDVVESRNDNNDQVKIKFVDERNIITND